MNRSAPAILLLVACVAAGCGGSSGSPDGKVNKAGAAARSTPQTIVIEAPDAGSPESQYLERRIEEHSNRTLRVKLELDYDSAVPANEVKLARALRAGREDFGFLPARAWSAAGAPAFAALHAPFVLTTYESAQAAVSGPAHEVLERELREAGVEPIAILPTQLRRLASIRPLTTPAAFRGARLRIVDNATTARDLAALGAVPRQGMSSRAARLAIEAGRIDGVETAPQFVLTNNYDLVGARHLTGYALFPKVETFVASPRALARLSAEQQQALRKAAADTARFAATQAERENADLSTLCGRGVHIGVPTEASLKALAAATEPVREQLASDDATAEVMRHLTATPGAGPRALPGPRVCRAAAGASRSDDDAAASIPEGTYVVTLTPDDYEEFGEHGEVADRPRTHRMTFRDGRISFSLTPEYGPQADRCVPACTGRYTIDGDRVTFDWDRPDWPSESARWSFFKGKLSFRDPDVEDAATKAVYLAHPWRRTD